MTSSSPSRPGRPARRGRTRSRGATAAVVPAGGARVGAHHRSVSAAGGGLRTGELADQHRRHRPSQGRLRGFRRGKSSKAAGPWRVASGWAHPQLHAPWLGRPPPRRPRRGLLGVGHAVAGRHEVELAPSGWAAPDPRLSRCTTSPASSHVTVWRPMWGWGPMSSRAPPASPAGPGGAMWSAKHQAPTVRWPRRGAPAGPACHPPAPRGWRSPRRPARPWRWWRWRSWSSSRRRAGRRAGRPRCVPGRSWAPARPSARPGQAVRREEPRGTAR